MLFNSTKNTVIASKVKIRKGMLGTSIGLMFQKLRDSEALVLDLEREGNAQIHTFFLRHFIDAVWLDANLKVNALKQNIHPFRFWVSPGIKARYIIELPADSIENYKISKGDKLHIIKSKPQRRGF